jgi:hypothetical protein
MRHCIGFVLVCTVVTGCASNDSPHEHPGAATGSSCTAGNDLTYDNFGRTFMETYCVPCHGSESSPYRNDPKAANFDFRTLEGVRANNAHIDVAAAAGPFAVNTYMPTSGPFPTEDDRRKLGVWLACGVP